MLLLLGLLMFILFPKENVAKVTIILFPTKFPMENYSLCFNFLLDYQVDETLYW